MLYFIWKADTFESSTSMRYFERFLWVCVCNPVVQWAVEWLSNNSYATAVLPVGEAKTINSSPMLLQPSLTLVLFPPIFPNHLPPSIRSPLIHVMPFFNRWVCLLAVFISDLDTVQNKPDFTDCKSCLSCSLQWERPPLGSSFHLWPFYSICVWE